MYRKWCLEMSTLQERLFLEIQALIGISGLVTELRELKIENVIENVNDSEMVCLL